MDLNLDLDLDLDRISVLPEPVIHRILWFLDPFTDLLRTSVLSKQWFNSWSSFPDFDFHPFGIERVIQRKKNGSGSHISCKSNSKSKLELEKSSEEKLLHYAAYNLSCFSKHTNRKVRSFRLCIPPSMESGPALALLDDWIGFSVGKHVEALQLATHYRLPNTILSAASLTSLALSYCRLPSSLMVDGVKFTALKSLSLCFVEISQPELTYLTTACPLIQDLHLFCCNGHENLSFRPSPTLDKLKRLELVYGGASMVDITAPNLTSFSCTIPCQYIKLGSSKNLKTFHLKTPNLTTTTTWLTEFMSNFPLLEDVRLDIRYVENKFELDSCPHLRKFELGECFNMKEIRIDAPNLRTFRYNGDLQLPPLLSLTSTCAKHQAFLSCHRVDLPWFQKLTEFADKFSPLALRVDLDIGRVNVDEMKATVNTPIELNHLKLKVKSVPGVEFEPLSSIYMATLDAIFWCCSPASVSCILGLDVDAEVLHINFQAWSNFFKYVYEKLVHQEDECLKDVQIVVRRGYRNGEEVFADLTSLLDVLPSFGLSEQIFFRTKRKASYEMANPEEWEWRGINDV